MDSSIGSLIPEHLRQNVVGAAVREGEVYRMHLGDDEAVKGKNRGDDGRNKYFIVLGHDSEGNAIGLVLINTNINQALPR